MLIIFIITAGLSVVSLIIGIGLKKDFFYWLCASLLFLSIIFLQMYLYLIIQ